jgi:CopG family transcriptional regulator, nickel-responsive regulator
MPSVHGMRNPFRNWSDETTAAPNIVGEMALGGLVAMKSATTRSQECVASLAYVYDPNTRELPKRLAHAFQDHHDLCVATMRVTLDHDSCMEVSALRGPTAGVQDFAERVIAERGVRHGRLNVIPAEIKSGRHAHGEGQAHPHEHIRVW